MLNADYIYTHNITTYTSTEWTVYTHRISESYVGHENNYYTHLFSIILALAGNASQDRQVNGTGPWPHWKNTAKVNIFPHSVNSLNTWGYWNVDVQSCPDRCPRGRPTPWKSHWGFIPSPALDINAADRIMSQCFAFFVKNKSGTKRGPPLGRIPTQITYIRVHVEDAEKVQMISVLKNPGEMTRIPVRVFFYNQGQKPKNKSYFFSH